MKLFRSIIAIHFHLGRFVVGVGMCLPGLPGMASAAAVTAQSALFSVDTRGRLFAEWAVAVGVPGGVLSGTHGASGQPLLVAYALGWSPAGSADFAARLPRWVPGGENGVAPVLTFVRPGAVAVDVRLVVEESADLKKWGEICRRDAAGAWAGPALVTELAQQDGSIRVAVALPIGPEQGIRWFRLRVEVL
ncbi:MAG: hypothetical protein V4675_14550 [Verrucomicrobiota bacterium]